MKKLVASLLGLTLFLIAPMQANALLFESLLNHFRMDGVTPIHPITITAEESGEVFAEHGIRIRLDFVQRILWDDIATATAYGTAVDSGAMWDEIPLTYSDDRKTIIIPVAKDWAPGDSVTISGLHIRSYDRALGWRHMMLDLNADGSDDFVTSLITEIREDNPYADRVAPFAPHDFTAEVIESPYRVKLSWQTPPDYDFMYYKLSRQVTRNGFLQDKETLFDILQTNSLTDSDVQLGDEVTYYIEARDSVGNVSPAASVAVVVQKAQEATQGTEDPENTSQEPENGSQGASEPQTEFDFLTDNYNYFNLRHQIKCQAGRELTSDCRFAKIDMAYAEEKLGIEPTVTLDDTEISLIAKRIRFTEGRYQSLCLDADEPAFFCNNLGRVIERMHHFID